MSTDSSLCFGAAAVWAPAARVQQSVRQNAAARNGLMAAGYFAAGGAIGNVACSFCATSFSVPSRALASGQVPDALVWAR